MSALMAIATVNCMGRGIASNLLWMSWKLQPKGEGEEGAKGIGQLHLPTLLIIHRYISREGGNDGGISDVMICMVSKVCIRDTAFL